MAAISFQRLPPIEPSQAYLEHALKKAAKRVGQLSPKGTALERRKKREAERIIMVRDAILKYLAGIITAYPSIDELPEFYRKLISATLDYAKLKKALGALRFAQEAIKRLSQEHLQRLQRQVEEDSIRRTVAQFLGRTSSVLRQIGPGLVQLEQARTTLRSFPSLDVEEYVVAIAGFPNVGKSTLLMRLTGAKPEIKDYAFTTKGLNVGSFEHRFHTIQCVDTPGTLGRSTENTIERLATITRQYAADLVVYVFDLTEPYPLADQEKLLRAIEKEGHDVILYLSKTDVLPAETVKAFVKGRPILTSAAQAKEAIIAHFWQART